MILCMPYRVLIADLLLVNATCRRWASSTTAHATRPVRDDRARRVTNIRRGHMDGCLPRSKRDAKPDAQVPNIVQSHIALVRPGHRLGCSSGKMWQISDKGGHRRSDNAPRPRHIG